MSIIDYNNFKQEIVFWLRNNDILSTSERDVTTTNISGSINGTELLIDVSNVKNIRSVIINGTTLSYGSDYTVNINYNNKTLITFTNTQSGSFVVNYDYGNDRIFPDLPKPEIKISNFPRLGVEIIGEDSEDNELGGGSEIVNLSFTIIVYSPSTSYIDDKISLIKSLMIQNKKNFYYSRYNKKLGTGPLNIFINSRNKIFQRNIDYISILNEEII